MNVVFIVSDTLRRDHLGCYGNETIRTPQLDRFAQQCIVFDECYAASFPTMPTRADFFTGKWTLTYLGWAPLPREETILSEVLRNAGYTTMAVVDTPFFIKNAYHYDRGFSDFLWIRGQGAERGEVNHLRRYEEDYCAPMTMAAAERWLERHYKEKFFLYVDTWDPHEPWDPPHWYVEPYYPGYDGKVVRPCYWYWQERGLTEEDVKIAHACYCGEVTMMDRWTGRLLERIESLDLMDKTVIIFTTDHGFYFGEHGGRFGKGMTKEGQWYSSPLYREVAQVPLLIYVPGIKAQRTDALVSLVDLMPTILELVEVEIPDTVQGQSMVPILKGEQEVGREFVVTSLPLYNPGDVTRAVDAFERRVQEYIPATITTCEWSLLYAAEGRPLELYNLKSDPKQEKNVIEENRQVAEDLHKNFLSLLEETNTDSRFVAPRQRL